MVSMEPALDRCALAHNPSLILGRLHIHPTSGPKGVINDWRRFKQLETEQREEQCREMERLIKKLSVSCRSHLDEEEEQRKQKGLQEKISGKVIRSAQAFLRGYLAAGVSESACQCRGHGFEPWSRKIPHAAEQLSPCATTTEPMCHKC